MRLTIKSCPSCHSPNLQAELSATTILRFSNGEFTEKITEPSDHPEFLGLYCSDCDLEINDEPSEIEFDSGGNSPL